MSMHLVEHIDFIMLVCCTLVHGHSKLLFVKEKISTILVSNRKVSLCKQGWEVWKTQMAFYNACVLNLGHKVTHLGEFFLLINRPQEC